MTDVNGQAAPTRDRLVSVVLDHPGVRRFREDLERERATAVRDLERDNQFGLNGQKGPFRLRLCCEEGRLVLDVRDERDEPLTCVRLSLQPFRGIIKDYITVCESYYTAIRSATLQRIEALDMGRRSLHNEGADLLKDQLARHATLDRATARRLFTLVCVLHFRR